MHCMQHIDYRSLHNVKVVILRNISATLSKHARRSFVFDKKVRGRSPRRLHTRGKTDYINNYVHDITRPSFDGLVNCDNVGVVNCRPIHPIHNITRTKNRHSPKYPVNKS